MSIQNLRRWFQTLKSTKDPATIVAIVRGITEMLFDPKFEGGLLRRLLDGGCPSDEAGHMVTGLIPSPPLSRVAISIRGADFPVLAQYLSYIQSYRQRYLIRLLAQAATRADTEVFDHSYKTLRLLHLNTFAKVPRYTPRPVLEVETVRSYGFPAIYVSSVIPQGRGQNTLITPCTKNVIEGRMQRDLYYNRGLLFECSPQEPEAAFFYLDQKISVPYRTFFLRRQLHDEEYQEFAPAPDIIAAYKSRVLTLVHSIASNKRPLSTLERGISFARHERFSFVNASLFELTCAFLSNHLPGVEPESILKQIDKMQPKHWTLRGFRPTLTPGIKLILSRHGLKLEHFARFIHEHLLTDLKQYLGDDDSHIDDLAIDNLFYRRINLIEQVENIVDPQRSEELPVPVRVPREAAAMMHFDPEGKRLVFHRAISRNDTALILAKAQPSERDRLQRLVTEHRLKTLDLHARESMGAATMRLIASREIGFCATRLQADRRGEYFLLPNFINGPAAGEVRVRRATVNVGVGSGNKLKIDQGDVHLAMRIKDFSPFDKGAGYFHPAWSSGAIVPAEEYCSVLRSFEREMMDQATHFLEKFSSQPYRVIAVPFFTETVTLLAMVEAAAKATPVEECLVLLLVSNLPNQRLRVRVSQIEARLFTARKAPWVVLAVGTERAKSVAPSIRNKYTAFWLATTLVEKLSTCAPALNFCAILEADLRHPELWWEAVGRSDIRESTLGLFEYDVYTDDGIGDATRRGESIDVDETIFYTLVAKPLSLLLLGGDYSKVLGSSYLLGAGLARRLGKSLQDEKHVFSIERSLFYVASDADVVRMTVGRKVHDVNKEMSDDKYATRIADFVEGMEEFAPDKMRSSMRRKSLRVPFVADLCRLITKGGLEGRVREAKDRLSKYRQIYAHTLGPSIYNHLLGLGGTNVSHGIRDFSWIQFLIRVLEWCVGQSDAVTRELFASIQPLAVLKAASMAKCTFELVGIELEKAHLLRDALVRRKRQAGGRTLRHPLPPALADHWRNLPEAVKREIIEMVKIVHATNNDSSDRTAL